jgi:hypothetical protein
MTVAAAVELLSHREELCANDQRTGLAKRTRAVWSKVIEWQDVCVVRAA